MDIRIEDLTKCYGPQKAVDAISFTVRAGEVLGFLGPNGAGKSTTMKLICGLTAPNAGKITVGGHDVAAEPEVVRRMIGYLPESNPLYEDMPVLDLLRFAAQLQAVPADRINERLRTMVDACGLDREKHKRVSELSKGYRQRVGLAQAMVHDPDVLILDEPTTGLDPNQIVEIRELIKELGQAKTVIFSTHILPEVEATCDRILIIDKGRIVADGGPAELRGKAQGRAMLHVRVEEAAQQDVLNAFRSIEQVEEVTTDGTNGYLLRVAPGIQLERSIFQLCVQRRWVLTGLHQVETRLEDVFRELTLD
ncbi:MAG: ATP-binding cassette domain-containing protein [Flavobacteriales bacterium]|nr:ATP-binding cassette domain-containing protein [Flavobacteriales bacterium]